MENLTQTHAQRCASVCVCVHLNTQMLVASIQTYSSLHQSQRAVALADQCSTSASAAISSRTTDVPCERPSDISKRIDENNYHALSLRVFLSLSFNCSSCSSRLICQIIKTYDWGVFFSILVGNGHRVGQRVEENHRKC